MTTWRFSLIIEGRDLDDDDTLDALFEAGCDDALFGGANGVQCADFHRDAEQIEDAVFSAIAAIESVAGLRVAALVEQGLVSAEEIAVRSGRAPGEVQAELEAPNGTHTRVAAPVPITPQHDPRRPWPVWRWSDVARRFGLDANGPWPDAEQHVFDALARAVDARRTLRHTPPDRRARIDEFIAAAATDNPPRP